jgi:hypothetical protein
MGAISDLMTTLTFYFKKSLIYFGVFILFTINLIALSISLSCNQEKYIGFRIVSALFAFLFGLVYIMFNYLQYRVKIKEETCSLCGNEPFPIGSAL